MEGGQEERREGRDLCNLMIVFLPPVDLDRLKDAASVHMGHLLAITQYLLVPLCEDVCPSVEGTTGLLAH